MWLYLGIALVSAIAAQSPFIDVCDLEAHQPGTQSDILVGKAVQDGAIAANILGHRARQTIDLAGSMAHVVDLPFCACSFPKAPVLRLKPLIAPVCEHLTRLHAPLQTPHWIVTTRVQARMGGDPWTLRGTEREGGGGGESSSGQP